MALARTLALVLMAAASPALAQVPAAAPTPAITAVADAPKVDDWPKGAPHTDYEFVGWCYGVLRQHMEFYTQVRPELTAISKRWKTEEEDEKSYADQMAAGKSILAEMTRALEMTERASPRPIQTQGAAAIEQGRKMWAEFNTVDKTMQAYSWMNWELPEKCPKVAKTLENRSTLMAPALRANQAAPAPARPEPKKAETPAGKPAASADQVGALITNAGKK